MLRTLLINLIRAGGGAGSSDRRIAASALCCQASLEQSKKIAMATIIVEKRRAGGLQYRGPRGCVHQKGTLICEEDTQSADGFRP